ncbi:glycosyltransferase family 39 protein [Acidianus brierleyi]|uniref:Glycosyltransferase n=1 Tax=Acidianus brierleyi TaxID=41673 RepID=A0A2U9IEC4_9CREN|nr:glycosyltransferase family 39 protein [Acidianus brierleyi]AWR94294.1 glycosyltransferase [Acidianus brierleyi]
MKKYNSIFYLALVIILIIYTYETILTFDPTFNPQADHYIGDEVWYPTAAYNILKYIFHITPKMYFPYSHESGIQYYINPEHPPLGKYFMDIFILILGYSPLAWRIPSWIMGDLIIVIGFLLSRKIIGDNIIGNLAGILTAIVIALDPTLWLLHGIALLDIYVGFFSILSLYLLISKRIVLASIALGLAMASKEPAFFLVLPFLYYLGEITNRIKIRALYSIGVPILVYALASIPIMLYFNGIMGWLHGSFLYMLGWDAENGHIALSATSQISEPWDWFLDIHPFYMGYNFYANVNPAIMFLWLFTTPIAFLFKDSRLITVTMWAWTEWLGFVLVYILGNHTLFSFYVADFGAVIDAYIVTSLFFLVQNMKNLKYKLSMKSETNDTKSSNNSSR